MYKQCWLKKNNTIQVAWIPSKFAKVGKYVELKEKDVWDNGWAVTNVGASMSVEEIKQKGRSQHWYGNDYVRKNGVWDSIR